MTKHFKTRHLTQYKAITEGDTTIAAAKAKVTQAIGEFMVEYGECCNVLLVPDSWRYCLRKLNRNVTQYTTPCSVVYCVTSVCVFSPHLFWAPVYTFRYKWVHDYIYICIYISVYLLFIVVLGAFVGVLYLSLYMLVDRKEFFQLLSFYT